ncbi:hypothetical protein FHR72_002947 [Mycolicibacterium iranicum]|uniref:MFS transporter n=1 Tax=Mycolicibacterium iranicum TaxID=912594 RepID=A0A839QDW2_MYCIR|nr:hypothetical protein [Mycolicibacterium iranicum]MBB2991462.1 hypothetical protein [Mycolicibacterium iranicum]
MRTPKARARGVRGALVGVSSAATTTGAHAAGGGGLPTGTALVLTLLLCATVGALIGSLRLTGRRTAWAATAAALGVAQFAGHAALTVAGHHHHGVDLAPGPAMIAAHVAAAIVLGGAISAAEYLYVVCASVLCWLQLFTRRAARPAPRIRRRATKVVVARPVLVTGRGMRAPPRGFATA